jgi:hypothetical protein
MTSGANAGVAREILSVTGTQLTFLTAFPSEIVTGDRYAVSGVPFKVQCWPIQSEGVSRFNRWNLVGCALKCQGLGGFTNNANSYWRVGAYRDNGTSIVATTVYVDVDENPSDSAGALNVDGVDIEPYIEQIAGGVKFELTDAEFNVSLTDSRKVAD